MLETSDAECCINVASYLKRCSGIVCCTLTAVQLARIKLGLMLLEKPNIAFRAMFEAWDYERIIEELY
jgi:3,4-dihydroxy-2-butanone 4-phosphate synthase